MREYLCKSCFLGIPIQKLPSTCSLCGYLSAGEYPSLSDVLMCTPLSHYLLVIHFILFNLNVPLQNCQVFLLVLKHFYKGFIGKILDFFYLKRIVGLTLSVC